METDEEGSGRNKEEKIIGTSTAFAAAFGRSLLMPTASGHSSDRFADRLGEGAQRTKVTEAALDVVDVYLDVVLEQWPVLGQQSALDVLQGLAERAQLIRADLRVSEAAHMQQQGQQMGDHVNGLL